MASYSFHHQFRNPQLELLDEEDIPVADLERNLDELEVINRLLGGHKASLKGIQYFGLKNANHTLLDIGSGGGDTLRAIAKSHFARHFSELHGADLKQICVQYANNKSLEYNKIKFYLSDYKLWLQENTGKYDIISNALFCHHFSNEALIEMLKMMKQHARIGFMVNDLQRHFLAYYSIKILTFLFSKSYLVKHDAPLSVARSFKRKDWEYLLKEAGIDNAQIKWSWAFRYIITWKR
jgi:2-polyprenyl-3-methyl-5-hydroxy-6-metoxy-1,4-benzoquinol methylase